MRGEYDKGMKTDDPAAVVRDVIRTQRDIVKDVYGSEDAVPRRYFLASAKRLSWFQLNANIGYYPELLALYKEVQDQYESGRLDVPDDVTLLFADDNFGSIRRLPSGAETQRKGGAGVSQAPYLLPAFLL